MYEIETPMGIFQVDATDDGICSLRFPGQLRRSVESREGDGGLFYQQAKNWLNAYFEGKPLPPKPRIDLSWCTDFGRAVYRALVQVPAGNVITYGDLANEVGRPGGARAVGSWMRKNRVPIFIPCHRVVQQNGSLGGWSGPDGMKAWLLDHEGRRKSGIQDLGSIFSR